MNWNKRIVEIWAEFNGQNRADIAAFVPAINAALAARGWSRYYTQGSVVDANGVFVSRHDWMPVVIEAVTSA